jgi:hypothetical protein
MSKKIQQNWFPARALPPSRAGNEALNRRTAEIEGEHQALLMNAALDHLDLLGRREREKQRALRGAGKFPIELASAECAGRA